MRSYFFINSISGVEVKTHAYILDRLAIDLNLGRNFMNEFNVIINFDEKYIKIDGKEIELNEDYIEKIPEPKKIIDNLKNKAS